MVLVFDISGRIGHFRKVWTTTSALTYTFPTYSATAGILGAIIGLDNMKPCIGITEEQYLDVFCKKDFEFAIQLKSRIRKTSNMLAVNILDTSATLHDSKSGKINRTQHFMEILVNPEYRIYVFCKNKEKKPYFDTLLDCISKHRTVYTVNLGSANFLADFKFVGTFNYQKKRNNKVIPVLSVVPRSKITKLEIYEGAEYMCEERFVINMSKTRECDYEDVYYERNGKPIYIAPTEYYEIEEVGNIVTL